MCFSKPYFPFSGYACVEISYKKCQVERYHIRILWIIFEVFATNFSHTLIFVGYSIIVRGSREGQGVIRTPWKIQQVIKFTQLMQAQPPPPFPRQDYPLDILPTPSWKLNPRVFKYPLLAFKTKKNKNKQIQKLKTKTPPEINKRKTQQKLKMKPKIKNKYSSNPTSKILAIICWGRKGLGKGLIFLSENYDFNKYFGNEN